MMFFWIFILIILFILLFKDNDLITTRKKNAKDILDERFARGEISIEEYKRMKQQMKENEL